ncbi:MAG: NAD(P)-binding domain-containing protein [Alphaproteobacteria bacterium]|nr:NAD(P)-binding domain-containing protein [Alphaproteobacteria bacterium]
MAADGPRLEAVVIGAGQGGLATSYLLRQLGIDHVVLERSAVAASWRERRWDSFCTVTPNWSIALPGAKYAGGDPDGFLSRDELVRHFERWAESFDAPLRCGVEVRAVRPDGDGFAVETDAGVWQAENVVVATGTYQAPHIPPLAGRLPGRVKQTAADDYKRPDMLAPGGVMVVGAGQTGCQIAEELHEAGREVWLCVGRAGRLPRRWRGRDCIEWQRDMGYLDRTPAMLESLRLRFRADPHLTGRDGGYTLSLHDFHRRGIRLLGRLVGCGGERARFDGGLHDEMRFADGFCERIAAEFDRHIREQGIDAPPPSAEELAGGPPGDGAMPEIRRELDLAGAGIANVVWAAGYRYDFSWIEAPVHD